MDNWKTQSDSFGTTVHHKGPALLSSKLIHEQFCSVATAPLSASIKTSTKFKQHVTIDGHKAAVRARLTP